MTLRTRATRLLLIGGVVVVVVFAFAAAPAGAQTSVGLTGETFESFGPSPNVTLQTRCNANGSGTITFAAQGEALGPILGTFTESGTIRLGDPITGPTGAVRRTLEFSATFHINSPFAQVDGRKFIIGEPVSPSVCGDGPLEGRDLVLIEIGTNLTGQVRYEATIRPTTGGIILDEGTSFVRASARNTFAPVATLSPAAFFESFRSESSSSDADGDGVPGNSDNCPTVANPGQSDTDGDGIGDACDADDDGDGVDDGPDNCDLTPNPDQQDPDGDGQGDACDPDDDNDAISDNSDNCPTVANADQRDTDGDGIGDACDPMPGSTPGCAIGVGTLQTNSRAGFAFGVRYRAGRPAPEGLLGFTDRATGKTLASGQITSVIIVGSHATIRGDGRTNGGQTVAFRVDVDDLSANGRLDTFTIQWPGYSASGTLRTGNVSLACPK
jgi:hypothetical protein